MRFAQPGASIPAHTRSRTPSDRPGFASYAATSRSANQTTMPQIKMIVSDWYTDEIGNQARIIKARD